MPISKPRSSGGYSKVEETPMEEIRRDKDRTFLFEGTLSLFPSQLVCLTPLEVRSRRHTISPTKGLSQRTLLSSFGRQVVSFPGSLKRPTFESSGSCPPMATFAMLPTCIFHETLRLDLLIAQTRQARLKDLRPGGIAIRLGGQMLSNVYKPQSSAYDWPGFGLTAPHARNLLFSMVHDAVLPASRDRPALSVYRPHQAVQTYLFASEYLTSADLWRSHAHATCFFYRNYHGEIDCCQLSAAGRHWGSLQIGKIANKVKRVRIEKRLLS